MHYYQFNIGNYRRKAHYLTILQHGVYRLLLDTYYLEETPLCLDNAKLMRTHSIRTEEEIEAFNTVINDFFIITDEGYHHDACDEEIQKYKDKSSKASASAKARWEKNANGMRTHSEGNANHKPITNNNKPSKEKDKKKAVAFTRPSIDDIQLYIFEKKYTVDPNRFIDHYNSNGWKVGKNSMKDWKAAIRTWQSRENKENEKTINNGQHEQNQGRDILGRNDTDW